MKLAAQYYRPPFPDQRFWPDDLPLMRESGLDAVYLWACWGWIEPEPGRFEFGDYDELVERASDAGLQVIFNVIGEIQPFWIHREFPDSRMVDHMGHEVVSSLRRECNVGLTPGGCTDHPGVKELMGRFIGELTRRYAEQEHLLAWDVWNETRWAVNADGHVCHCAHTLAEFRRWLQNRHGDLHGLNRAWRRRYSSWDDVYPGKVPGRTYTEMMEFQAFLTWRSREYMAFRAEIVRAADPNHLVVAHAANPATHAVALDNEQAISRGNDWEHADLLDGFGASVFPAWPQVGLTNTDVGVVIECARSAAQTKIYWVGEMQGGSARSGIEVNESVAGDRQQRWVWSAIGRGAKALSFWCWRDEVFGRESSGFGLIGNDGARDDRLRALRATGDLLKRHRDEVDAYRPDPARVAVVFEPVTYQLDWAANGLDSDQAQPSLLGYLEALERLQIPYDVLEARHRARLDQYGVVLMPWPLVVDPGLAHDLLDWVRGGGTLVVESEVDAYDLYGFYRYPDERPFANALGIHSHGRRVADRDHHEYELDGTRGELPVAGWIEPLAAPDGAEALLIKGALGAGQVIAVGGFPGLAHRRERSAGFEEFLRTIVRSAEALPALRCSVADGSVVQWRTGDAGGRRLLFVANAGSAATLGFEGPLLAGAAEAWDLVRDRKLPLVEDESGVTLTVEVPADGHTIVRWSEAVG
ncbi:beta-galactosidase [Actinomadura mexicana]|uniref:beta-galactosidase n=1 Tax=Actinomadura mexicana TaxID=134959 RepID=A0A238XEY0_9ACTN|nr:beta-galactosidase [Actinomadura mexicana]SNR57270.1 beta-galactosidase [Actinomadura mexicana]